jgi:hypothetical protein
MKKEYLVKGCLTLCEHLFSILGGTETGQWIELGIDEKESGTRTILSGNTKEEIVAAVETCPDIMRLMLKVGFDHVFVDIWENTDGSLISVKSAKTDSIRLYETLVKEIPAGEYELIGEISFSERKFSIVNGYGNEGAYYKNELAYVFFMNFPCYAGELYEDGEYDTREVFLDCLSDESEDTTKLSFKLFQHVCWQNPYVASMEI